MLADPKTLHREAVLALTRKSQIKQIVWVIDQFEEVFTLCAGEADRSQFFANILFASSIPGGPCVTLLTMRADFYWKCAAYSELSARIAAQQFLVSPMDADMLRQAIEEPARHEAFSSRSLRRITGDAAKCSGNIRTQSLPPCFGGLPFVPDNRRCSYSQPPEYRESGGTIQDRSDYGGPGSGADSGYRSLRC